MVGCRKHFEVRGHETHVALDDVGFVWQHLPVLVCSMVASYWAFAASLVKVTAYDWKTPSQIHASTMGPIPNNLPANSPTYRALKLSVRNRRQVAENTMELVAHYGRTITLSVMCRFLPVVLALIFSHLTVISQQLITVNDTMHGLPCSLPHR